MSRIRTIKPTFWSSAQVVECSLSTRLLFIGLWNFCDKAGRRSFSPKQIKGQVFPSDDITIDAIENMLWELSSNGLVRIYDNDNIRLLEVTGWRHQRIDNECSSRLPGPFDEHSLIIQRQFSDDSSKDLGIRNKELGKEYSPRKRGPRAFSRNLEAKKDEFERFWAAYGHKQQRKKAEAAFAKALAKTTLETILASVAEYHKNRPAWQQIALAASWLNGERWADQIANGHDGPLERSYAEKREGLLKWLEDQGLTREEAEKRMEKSYGQSGNS